MARFWLALVLILNCFYFSHMFILSLKNPDGSLDNEHLIGHMTLLEQTVTSLQQTVKTQDADIVALKTEISNLKSNQQSIAGQHADIATMKTEISYLKANQQSIAGHHADIVTMKNEISNLKTNQQKMDTRIFDLQKQTEPSQMTAVLASLKGEVNSAKAEVRLVSTQVISLISEFKNVTRNHQSLSSKINSTCLSADHNITATVKYVQDTLTRVLSRVHSAETDRFLLHSYVTRLNKTVSEVNNATTTDLSKQIAQLNSEVGFEIWMSSSIVNVTSGAIFKFDDIKYNIGGGYNVSTGVFTAPVSGRYLLWTQVMKYAGSSLRLYIEKAGSHIGTFYTPTAGFVTGSVITAAHVGAGEQVHVTISDAESVSNFYSSRFGGTLLYRH